MSQMDAQPAVWVHTTRSSYNGLRAGGYPAFLSDEQKARLERIRQARMLYDGKHREYFIGENRTQFNFTPTERPDGDADIMYVPLNVLKLISDVTAELLFGEEPLLRVEDEIQQEKLDDLVEDSNICELLRNTAAECSYDGEAFIEGCIHNGEVYLKRIPADQLFPVGDLMPDGQYERYVRYELKNKGTKEVPLWLLLETWYLSGSIERKIYQLDKDMKKDRQVDLGEWPMPAGAEALQPKVATGIADNTITWIPNKLNRDRAVSDYDDLIGPVDALNAKNTQLHRVLQQHFDPAMAVPENLTDEKGNVRAADKVFTFSNKDEIPQYIVWQAQVDAAQKDRSFALQILLIIARVSPALLGLKEGAAPDAWKKLRLEASNTLSMVKGKAKLWMPRIRRMLMIAQALEQTIPGTRYELKPISAEVRDGIPIDDMEQAETISLLTGGKPSMSVERAVTIQLPNPAAAAKELEQLKEEAASAMPATLLGEPSAQPGDAASVQPDQQQQQGAA